MITKNRHIRYIKKLFEIKNRHEETTIKDIALMIMRDFPEYRDLDFNELNQEIKAIIES